MAQQRWIRASEVNAYGYCARGWWLHYVLGLAPEDRGQFVAGSDRHQAHSRQVLHAEALRRAALAMLLAAGLLGAVALFFLLRGG